MPRSALLYLITCLNVVLVILLFSRPSSVNAQGSIHHFEPVIIDIEVGNAEPLLDGVASEIRFVGGGGYEPSMEKELSYPSPMWHFAPAIAYPSPDLYSFSPQACGYGEDARVEYTLTYPSGLKEESETVSFLNCVTLLIPAYIGMELGDYRFEVSGGGTVLHHTLHLDYPNSPVILGTFDNNGVPPVYEARIIAGFKPQTRITLQIYGRDPSEDKFVFLSTRVIELDENGAAAIILGPARSSIFETFTFTVAGYVLSRQSDLITLALVPQVECGDGLLTRFAPSVRGIITSTQSVNLLSAPASDEIISMLPPGERFVVREGPRCGADGLAYYKIDFAPASGEYIEGWIAESSDGVYSIEPTFY
jgi:hypothetical protein